MRSVSLDSTISRFPQERKALGRFSALLNSLTEERDYTFEHLYRKVRPSSPEVFALILADLVNRGLVTKLIRVESPVGKGGIADFSTLADVPQEIHDWRTDRDLPVQPENLRVFFKLQPQIK